MVTLITPVVEVDGRNRMVDIYNWHLANPNKNWPSLIYWGKYVAHDNNRDAIGLSLKLTRNVLNTYLSWKPQVLHDLHESVPVSLRQHHRRWSIQRLGRSDSDRRMADDRLEQRSEMTKFGMPGVFAHGNFDTWSPGYLMFIAATHNGISRLYETFGNAGADTLERTLVAERISTHLVSPEPAVAESEVVAAKQQQLPADGVVDDHALLRQQQQTLPQKLLPEEQALDREAEERRSGGLRFPGDDAARRQSGRTAAHAARRRASRSAKRPRRSRSRSKKSGSDHQARSDRPAGRQRRQLLPKTEDRTFPAGSYIVRMDQPYSRIADALLDYQYWAPNDPQQDIYDDTAWTMGELANVEVVRVVDTKVLQAPMERVTGECDRRAESAAPARST